MLLLSSKKVLPTATWHGLMMSHDVSCSLEVDVQRVFFELPEEELLLREIFLSILSLEFMAPLGDLRFVEGWGWVWGMFWALGYAAGTRWCKKASLFAVHGSDRIPPFFSLPMCGAGKKLQQRNHKYKHCPFLTNCWACYPKRKTTMNMTTPLRINISTTWTAFTLYCLVIRMWVYDTNAEYELMKRQQL